MIKNYQMKSVKVKDIKFDFANPNSMTEAQLDALRFSIKKFGQLKPPVIDQTMTVCDGEHGVKAYIAEGMEDITVIQVECTPDERRLIRQTMNKLHGTHDHVKDLAEYDALVKAGLLTELGSLLARDEKDFQKLLEQQEKQLTRGIEVDKNPMSGKLDAYLYGAIRQVLLYFDQKQYDEVMGKLEMLRQKFAVDNNSDVFLKLVKFYEEKNTS